MYEVQSKKRKDDLREGWISYPEGFIDLAAAMEAMAYQAESNPQLMHRVVQRIDKVVAMMPDLDTSCHPEGDRYEDAS